MGLSKDCERQKAYKTQEEIYGGLPNALQAKIDELIRVYDPINKRTLKSNPLKPQGLDPRLPMPGSFISKKYKGQKIEVKVLENGFEYQGTIYKNLSQVASIITGDHWNGFTFFGLNRKK